MDRGDMGELTPELKAYYEARFTMCCEKGWKDLIADVQEMLNATDRLSGVEDEKTLHFRKGEISIMRWLLSLERVSEEAYAQLTGEQDG
jgi:hypothetical protein